MPNANLPFSIPLPKIYFEMGPIRQNIYNLIVDSPGLHFRELQRRTKMATGCLQYHLEYMKNRALLSTINDGQYLRFYPDLSISMEERRVLEFARLQSTRHILIYIMENGNSSHEIIVKNIDLSPSTISWHLKKLVKAKVVIRLADGRRAFFKVSNPELVLRVLSTYKTSFLDNLVNNFIEMWDK